MTHLWDTGIYIKCNFCSALFEAENRKIFIENDAGINTLLWGSFF